MRKRLYLLFSVIVLLSLPFLIAQAAAVNPCPAVQGILNRILGIFNGILAGIAAIMFAWAGFLYLTARGEPNKIGTANKILIFAIIGVAIILLSDSIPNWVAFIVNSGAGCPST